MRALSDEAATLAARAASGCTAGARGPLCRRAHMLPSKPELADNRRAQRRCAHISGASTCAQTQAESPSHHERARASTPVVDSIPVASKLRFSAPSPRTTQLLSIGLLIVLLGLVCLRSWVFISFPHSHMDAAQAVFGLMAKDISLGRAFPLFMYGQRYMLAVGSWLCAPLFALFGPKVA